MARTCESIIRAAFAVAPSSFAAAAPRVSTPLALANSGGGRAPRFGGAPHPRLLA